MSGDVSPVVVWFRQDLRLADNPALMTAVQTGAPVLPVYILDDENSGAWSMGGASRWWLHKSLESLDYSLNGGLHYRRGEAGTILTDIIRTYGAGAVFWNRCYEPWRIRRDENIEEYLTGKGITVRSFNGSLLFEPHTALKDDGTPYKVFTPFFKRGCRRNGREPREPLEKPATIPLYEEARRTGRGDNMQIQDLGLMPSIPWYEGMESRWTPGESGARARLDLFLENGLSNYKEARDYPARDSTSGLSPHLHFGEISPHAVWYAAKKRMVAEHWERDGEHFLSELGWREFSYSLLYHFPDLPRKNLQQKFDHFPWMKDDAALERWQRGMTGYPIVDAGMRQLWKTGYMHNRVRMIVGSFLVKNLLLHWHHGEEWFWDTLVDADLANNSASWQWIAGCGADAAPYFRVFNPVTQGKKFDSGGAYVRRFVPELAKLPDKYIHAPWEAPEEVLHNAGVTLGKDYPAPIVDLKSSRERVLEAFQTLKGR